MKVVFASHNQGKIHEMQTLLMHLDIELIPQATLGITDIEETGLTFIENALLKARHAAQHSGLPAIADDSGLIVPALNGAPGIYSARYAGKNADAKQNIEKLLFNLKDQTHRMASFHCTLVYLTHATDPTPLVCEAQWYGKILMESAGEQGFGYDPIFFDESENCSAAQLPLDKKNRISHRGQALHLLLKKLPEKLCLHSQ